VRGSECFLPLVFQTAFQAAMRAVDKVHLTMKCNSVRIPSIIQRQCALCGHCVEAPGTAWVRELRDSRNGQVSRQDNSRQPQCDLQAASQRKLGDTHYRTKDKISQTSGALTVGGTGSRFLTRPYRSERELAQARCSYSDSQFSCICAKCKQGPNAKACRLCQC
jgi:hypothetical protein